MRPSPSLALVALAFSYVPVTHAWGAAGHEIVATIAQMYLHPTVIPTICSFLSDSDKSPSGSCHLAPLATWADRFKYRMRWSAALHYVGALDDHPSKTCAFPGARGWAGAKQDNVLDGIKNTTGLLEEWVEGDVGDATAGEAVKFLVHFVGDMHQPLHLTGRDRGGNSVKVLWGRRQTNLHSLWDGLLIAKALRTVPQNYSRPLPGNYPQVEAALRGTIYDSYIRRILWEGALHDWADELPTWLECPSPASGSVAVQDSEGQGGMWQTVLGGLSDLYARATKEGTEINPDGPIVCPYHWAQPLHKLNCDIVWPPALDAPPFDVRFNDAHSHDHKHDSEDSVDLEALALDGKQLLDLDTPEYAGVIEKQKILERLLLQGGVRLAGLLNYLFADEGIVGSNASAGKSRDERRAFLWDLQVKQLPVIKLDWFGRVSTQ
ncbi:S1/P1 nuclease-domain-containing protein [Crassisporium funariophilum]|nr:S1/P1 nuclease-domain-containing protein [Crassisporium funariophilum]